MIIRIVNRDDVTNKGLRSLGYRVVDAGVCPPEEIAEADDADAALGEWAMDNFKRKGAMARQELVVLTSSDEDEVDIWDK